jgi:hypothetical protein
VLEANSRLMFVRIIMLKATGGKSSSSGGGARGGQWRRDLQSVTSIEDAYVSGEDATQHSRVKWSPVNCGHCLATDGAQ